MQGSLQQSLKQHFGFENFRPGQETVISKVTAGESTAAIFPTGAGKSLCYQLPAVVLPHLTLVVSPLLSLMQDQLEFLLSRNIRAARLDSSLSGELYNRVLRQAANGELKVLMISVERFKNEVFRQSLSRMKISLLVIDEAHCISEWGHNFRPEYLRLPDYQAQFQIPQCLLLTATATKEVQKDMCAKFRIPFENLVNTGFYRSNLHLGVTAVDQARKNSLLAERLKRSKGKSSIVYVTLQNTAESVASYLVEQGLSAAAYHAGMDNKLRESLQSRFMNGEVDCVVATIAFGMGIDKSNIRYIYHYDLPKSIENYSQEIGRAGRDGIGSYCEVLANLDNLPVLENFIYGDTPDLEGIQKVLDLIMASEGRWECKIQSLSKKVNIRLLPLKTLLVYLSMRRVIEPLYTYFEDYSFKFLQSPEHIVSQFQGSRLQFASDLFQCCCHKKTWSYLNMPAMEQLYPGERKRVIAALNYFTEQGWMELKAKQSVEAYRIVSKPHKPELLAEELYGLYKQKEKTEIKRIHNMIAFFESETCLSFALAGYFGEASPQGGCGHCSVCEGRTVQLKRLKDSWDGSGLDQNELLHAVRTSLAHKGSPENSARFLCGISTPLLQQHKAKSLQEFGSLSHIPYQKVLSWLRGDQS